MSKHERVPNGAAYRGAFASFIGQISMISNVAGNVSDCHRVTCIDPRRIRYRSKGFSNIAGVGNIPGETKQPCPHELSTLEAAVHQANANTKHQADVAALGTQQHSLQPAVHQANANTKHQADVAALGTQQHSVQPAFTAIPHRMPCRNVTAARCA